MKAYFTFYQHCNYIKKLFYSSLQKKMKQYDFTEWEDPFQHLVLAI